MFCFILLIIIIIIKIIYSIELGVNPNWNSKITSDIYYSTLVYHELIHLCTVNVKMLKVKIVLCSTSPVFESDSNFVLLLCCSKQVDK